MFILTFPFMCKYTLIEHTQLKCSFCMNTNTTQYNIIFYEGLKNMFIVIIHTVRVY